MTSKEKKKTAAELLADYAKNEPTVSQLEANDLSRFITKRKKTGSKELKGAYGRLIKRMRKNRSKALKYAEQSAAEHGYTYD